MDPIALSKSKTPNEAFITTNDHQHESILPHVSIIMGNYINRQRCLFHIEKNVAHRIEEGERNGRYRLIKFDVRQKPNNVENRARIKESWRN